MVLNILKKIILVLQVEECLLPNIFKNQTWITICSSKMICSFIVVQILLVGMVSQERRITYTKRLFKLLKKKILISLNLIILSFMEVTKNNGRGIMWIKILEKIIGQTIISYRYKDKILTHHV